MSNLNKTKNKNLLKYRQTDFYFKKKCFVCFFICLIKLFYGDINDCKNDDKFDCNDDDDVDGNGKNE